MFSHSMIQTVRVYLRIESLWFFLFQTEFWKYFNFTVTRKGFFHKEQQNSFEFIRENDNFVSKKDSC